MEEQVGQLWHRLVSRWSRAGHPGAAVPLATVERAAAMMFRALGGDGALRVTAIDANSQGGRRSLAQLVAGGRHRVALAWRDDSRLYLPARVDHFADPALNRDLLLWLAALAATPAARGGDWMVDAQQRVLGTLARCPGLVARYRRLAQAHLAQRLSRPPPGAADAALELAVCCALAEPGSIDRAPPARREPWPVPLWLHPDPPRRDGRCAARDDPGAADGGAGVRQPDSVRRRGELVESHREQRGLVTIRMENILSFGEFVNVDRGQEDEDDDARSESAARDLDRFAIGSSRDRRAARLRFDLDLPAEADDDVVIDRGLLLPEWDHRRGVLLPDRCRVVEMTARRADDFSLPARLAPVVRRKGVPVSQHAPPRRLEAGQPDGEEIDLDAYQRYLADAARGGRADPGRLYRCQRRGQRDLACLLLADLSLSTDAHVDDSHRVIDVIRDSLYLFAEALDAAGDRFAMYGFSSRRRDPIRVHRVKSFDEPYGAAARGRTAALRPGFYTRLGAGVRFATGRLAAQAASRRLLLILTDGKPNDLDAYEGRHGVEDTRAAVREARQAGLLPFCVTIDRTGNEYLPYLFGAGRFAVVARPVDLPRRLAGLYALMTR